VSLSACSATKFLWLVVLRLFLHCPVDVDVHAFSSFVFFFQAEDGIRDVAVTGVQTCALPIYPDTVQFCKQQYLDFALYCIEQRTSGYRRTKILPVPPEAIFCRFSKSKKIEMKPSS